MSHWTHRGRPFTEIPEGAFGFVYLIIDREVDKRYIGRKYFYSTRRIKRVGKSRRKVVVKESDWRTYVGSSTALTEAIENNHDVGFEILVIAYTKGQLNYLEEYVQYSLNALLDEKYYNNAIGSKRYMALKDNRKLLDIVKGVEYYIK